MTPPNFFLPVLSMEEIRAQFEGKTIEKLDNSAVNCWTFCFTDGSKIRVDIELRHHSSAGSIYGFEVLKKEKKVSDPC